MNEITVKVIDYFKRICSTNTTNCTSVPQTSSFTDPPPSANGSDHSNQTFPSSVQYVGRDAPSTQYFPHPPVVTTWPIFSPSSSNETWPGSTNPLDPLLPFSHPNTYVNQTQPCPVRSPAPWMPSFPPVVSITSDSLTELIMHYQRLGFHPPEQIAHAPGAMRESCLILQSPADCVTQSTPHPNSHQPQTRQHHPQAQHDGLSCQPWAHPAISQPAAGYPPPATGNQPPTTPVTSTSSSGIGPMNRFVVGQELIERFVNRTHALYVP